MSEIGLWAQAACLWEATARKPGNVHRFNDFADTHYLDFVLSSAALAPVLESAPGRTVGQTILEGVRATRAAVGRNTNLGIVLLLAPLAAVPAGVDLRAGVAEVLRGLSVDDARLAYEAIRLARPGGLGRATEQDVAEAPTETLRAAMARAAERDLIARQYAEDYRLVFDDGAPTLAGGVEHTKSLEGAIILGQLHLMSRYPDSLIARKRGAEEAREAGERARAVLTGRWPHKRPGWEALRALDAWLRADGNGRNPGTTADLVAACLFVLLRQGVLTLPCAFPWSAGPGPAGGGWGEWA